MGPLSGQVADLALAASVRHQTVAAMARGDDRLVAAGSRLLAVLTGLPEDAVLAELGDEPGDASA
jgi:hypothetical protein